MKYLDFNSCNECGLIRVFKDRGVNDSHIPDSLRIYCTSSIDFQGPTCKGRSPSLNQTSLQNRIIHTIREWVNWTPWAPCRHSQRAGYVVIMLISSASCPIREKPLPPVSHTHTTHAWLLSLAFCRDLAAILKSSSGSIFFHHEFFLNWRLPHWLGLSLCFCLGVKEQGHFVYFTINHNNIFLFTPLTFPGISLLSVPIRLCQKHSNLIHFAACNLLTFQNSKRRFPAYYPVSCFPTLSSSPEASIVVSTHTTFSNSALLPTF